MGKRILLILGTTGNQERM